MFVIVYMTAALLAIETSAQSSTPSDLISTVTGSAKISGSIPNAGGDLIPTGTQVTYLTYSSQIAISGLSHSTSATASNSSITSTFTTTTTISGANTLVLGSVNPVSSNETSTSTAAAPTNTQPCNGSPSFCSRSYSNITFVGAHNSPFDIPNNVASNQEYGVIPQLNDGIRMLQGQTHLVNNTLHFCHTSCQLLDTGTVLDYLTNVTRWLAAHPYEVVTILLGNGNLIPVDNFVGPIQQSGLIQFAYTPPLIPMRLADWPNVGEMILQNKRAIIFLDYKADQTTVPYVLDEFSQLWETPFDPTNRSFPCVVQRPPNLSNDDTRKRMYMLNHNLNIDVQLFGQDILIPDRTLLNETNAMTGYGSLGTSANDCEALHGRPPNFLLVDYYNNGPTPGSVFQVAAGLNGALHGQECCGDVSSMSAARRIMTSSTGKRWVCALSVIIGISIIINL